jgi:WD40 repeat protein
MSHRSLLYSAILLVLVSAGPGSGQTPVTEATPSSLWPELTQVDASKAYRAMRRLATMPDATLRFLRANVPAARQTTSDKLIDDLIRQLDSDQFAERDKAQRELETLDWQTLPALRKAAQAGGALELKRRLDQLVGRAEGPPVGTNLRWHRAVEVVVWIGAGEAKTLLEQWSHGAPASRLTEEASRALKRWDAGARIDVPAKRPVVDNAGDPVPAGAVMRLGSERWRVGSGSIGYDRGGIMFTSDAKSLVIAGGDTVAVMDVSIGKVVRQRACQGYISSAQLSPDGRRLVLSGWIYANNARTPFVQVCDAGDLSDIATWNIEGIVEGFMDDGKRIVLSTDKGLRRLDAVSGLEVDFTPFAKGVTGPLRQFNGQTAVARNRGSALCVFPMSAPEKLRNLDMPEGNLRCVALSADGKYLAIGGDYGYSVVTYDLDKGEPIRAISAKRPDHDFVVGLAFSPDSRTLVFSSGHDEPVVVLWDLQTHRPRWKVSGYAGQMTFSPDGKLIAGNSGWRTCVWDAATGKEISAIDETVDYQELAFAADGRTLVTLQNGAVGLLDFPSGKERMCVKHPNVHHATLSPDGRSLATSQFNHDLRLWEVPSGRELCRLPDAGSQSGFARELQFTSDSRRLCTWEADFRMLVWDAKSGRLLAEHAPRPEGFPKEVSGEDARRRRRGLEEKLLNLGHGFSFSTDGSQFVWLFNKLRAYDTATGKLLRTFDEEISPTGFRPRLSDDGELLLLLGRDRAATIFNLRRGKKQGQVALTNSSAYALAPDGRAFAVATSWGAQHQITLYETATLQPRLTIGLQFNYPQGLSFSPDGRFLAACLADRTVLIWDMRAPEI